MLFLQVLSYQKCERPNYTIRVRFNCVLLLISPTLPFLLQLVDLSLYLWQSYFMSILFLSLINIIFLVLPNYTVCTLAHFTNKLIFCINYKLVVENWESVISDHNVDKKKRKRGAMEKAVQKKIMDMISHFENDGYIVQAVVITERVKMLKNQRTGFSASMESKFYYGITQASGAGEQQV